MIQTMGENTVNSQKREIIIMKKKNRQDILSSTKFSNCFAKLLSLNAKISKYKIQHQKYSVRQMSWVTDR